jgi:addiction module RelE/StbE family toxin
MEVVWLRRAAFDLEAIEKFINQRNPMAARKTVQAIYSTISLLREQPEIGRIGRVAGTRELAIPATPYVVVYEAGQDAVLLLAVMHGARKWPGNF